MQAQAITSKWDLFDEGGNAKRKGITEPDDDDEDDVDGVPLNHEDNQLDLRVSEDRRARLREIEIQVMRYQDELESGKQAVKTGWTISEQASSCRSRHSLAETNSAHFFTGRSLPEKDHSRQRQPDCRIGSCARRAIDSRGGGAVLAQADSLAQPPALRHRGRLRRRRRR